MLELHLLAVFLIFARLCQQPVGSLEWVPCLRELTLPPIYINSLDVQTSQYFLFCC